MNVMRVQLQSFLFRIMTPCNYTLSSLVQPFENDINSDYIPILCSVCCIIRTVCSVYYTIYTARMERKEKLYNDCIILEAGFTMVYFPMRVYSDQFCCSIMEMRTAESHRIVDTKRYRIHLFSLEACRDRPTCNWPVHLREKTLVEKEK